MRSFPRKLGGTKIVLLSQMVLLGLGAIPSVLVFRALGPDQAGVYAALARFSALALSVASLSYGHGLAQYAAKAALGNLRSMWTGGFALLLPCSVFLWILLGAGMFLSIGSGFNGILELALFAAAGSLQLLILSGQHVLRGLQLYEKFSGNRVAQAAIWTVEASFLFVTSDLTLLTISISWFIAQALTLVLILKQLVQIGVTPSRNLDVRRALSYGLSAHVGVVGRDVSPFLDQLVVIFVLNALALGLYVPASTYGSVVLAVGIGLAATVQPRVAAALNKPDQVVSAYSSVGRAALLATIAASILAPLGPWLIPLVYGTDFETAGYLGSYLVVGAAFDVVTLTVVSALMGAGRPRTGSWLQLGGTVLLCAGLSAALSIGGIQLAGIGCAAAYFATMIIAVTVLIKVLPPGKIGLAALLAPTRRRA